MPGKRLLLVEGDSDKRLHEEFCSAINLNDVVTIAPPKEAGGRRNTKQGVLNLLDTLLPNLMDGQLERLGVIVDADLIADGGGFTNTVSQVSRAVESHGYISPPGIISTGGLLYVHNDGLPDVGLWIMPNNQDEGAVEKWISDMLLDAERVLLGQAVAVVGGLATPKFRASRRKKAEMATWMAWQDEPGRGLHYAVQSGLLNPAAPLYAGFKQWMERVFR